MKKLFVLLIAVSLMSVFSAKSYAAASFTSDEGTMTKGKYIELGNTDKVKVKLSAGVEATYGYVVKEGSDYAAATFNDKGTGREYATGSAVSTIYYKTGVTSLGNPPNFQEGTEDYSGWSTF